MKSVPAYTGHHSGPVLVCGSAWCLHDDVAQARKRWPDAPVIAVNDACGEVPAFALYSMHPRKFPMWIAARKRLGGDFSVHSDGKAHVNTNIGLRARIPWVDYWWEGTAYGGTSTWCARRLAGAMGFDLVVLCGMPLEPGPYATGGMVGKQFRGGRDGSPGAAIEHYRQMVLNDTDWHDGVVSMSGWTREVFGDG